MKRPDMVGSVRDVGFQGIGCRPIATQRADSGPSTIESGATDKAGLDPSLSYTPALSALAADDSGNPEHRALHSRRYLLSRPPRSAAAVAAVRLFALYVPPAIVVRALAGLQGLQGLCGGAAAGNKSFRL